MLSSKIKRTVAIAMAAAMMTSAVIPASATEYVTEDETLVSSEAQTESSAEEGSSEVSEETEETSEESSEVSSEESSEESSESSLPEESETSKESSEVSEIEESTSEESSAEESEAYSEEETTVMYDEASFANMLSDAGSSDPGATSVAEDVKFVPGNYTITTNVYIDYNGSNYFLTNPNNTLEMLDSNSSYENALPTTAVAQNATITIGEDGVSKIVTLPIVNPAISLHIVGKSTNAEIIYSITNASNVYKYGQFTGRIQYMSFQLNDNSGTYTFTDNTFYNSYTQSNTKLPFTVAVDLASVPVDESSETPDVSKNVTIGICSYNNWVGGNSGTPVFLAYRAYSEFESAEVDGVTIEAKTDSNHYYNCFAYQGKTWFNLSTTYMNEYAGSKHTLTLNYKDGYKATTTFYFKRSALAEKLVNPVELEYTGYMINAFPNLNPKYYSWIGTIQPKALGSYHVTFTLKPGYAWTDGTADVLDFDYKVVEPKTKVEKPTIQTKFTYDGSEQSVIAENKAYTLEGVAKAKKPGNYEVTVKLNNGYVWEDGSNDDITINWTIDSIKVAVPTANENLVYNGETQIGVNENEAYTLDGVTSAVKVGNYEATATLNEGYTWEDGLSEPIKIKWKISPIEIAKPTANENLVYNGETQIGVNEGTGYTLENATAVDAGNYQATATLEEGYAWINDSTDIATIDFSIAKADQKIKVKLGHKTYTVWSLRKSAQSFDIGASAKSELTYEVTNTPDGAQNAISVDENGKVTVSKNAPLGKYTILVKAVNNNYNEATRTIAIKVIKSPQTVNTKIASKTYTVTSMQKSAKSFDIGATAKSEISYKVTRTPKGGFKYITVDNNGKVTLKKGAIKGTYAITVTANESATHREAKATVTIVVK